MKQQLPHQSKKIEYGYACNNMSTDFKVGRTMRKATFQKFGLEKVSELVIKNLTDLQKILTWNVQNGIYLYRMSSSMFPWASEYKLSDLPQINIIIEMLKQIGWYVEDHGIRLTYHPGQFTVLGSPNEKVVKNAITELEHHAEIMDLIGLSNTPYNKINIHMGGAYGDKSGTIDRFVNNFHKLSDSVKSRLTIENEDKVSLFTVEELMEVHKRINIPIVFDYLHHRCNPGKLSEMAALEMALSTWNGVKPVVHYSESLYDHNGQKASLRSHTDYVYNRIPLYWNKNIDIMIEAKAKDKAVLQYKQQYVK